MAGKFSLEAVFSGKDSLSRVVGKISGQFDKMARSARAPLKSIAKLNDEIVHGLTHIVEKAAEASLAFAGIGAGIELAEILHEGIQTEAAISRLGSVSMRTSEQMEELSRKAKDVGAQGKFTAAEIMGAMELLERASMTDAQVVESIDSIAAAAKIDRIEVEEASKLIVGAVKAMGQSGPEMGKHVNEMADMLAVARDHTTASMSDIVSAIDSVAPVARELNIPVAQVTASIVGLTNAGLDAGSAGQALSTMFIKLSKMTPKMNAQLTAMGVKFTDAHGDMLPMNDVLENIAKRMGKAHGNFKEMGKLAEMVGGKGTKAALALEEFFKSGDMEKLTAALENSGGAAQKTAALIGDNIGGDLTKIQARVRGFSDELFELGAGSLRDVTSGTLKWIDANKEMVKGKVVEYIHDIAKGLPIVASYAVRMWPLVKTFLAVSAAVKVLTVATKLWTAASEMNPWVAALGAVLIAATLLVAFWPQIKQFFSEHQVAIAAVGGSLALLAAMIYGPAGINMAMSAASGAIGGAKASAVLLQGALQSLNAVSFAGLLASVAAVGAAVGAVMLAVDQANKMGSETEGLGVTGTIGQMITQGTWDPSKAVDTYQNEQAQRRALQEGKGPELTQRHHYYHAEDDGADKPAAGGNTTNELVVSPAPGTKAAWKNAPKKGTPIKINPSGAF